MSFPGKRLSDLRLHEDKADNPYKCLVPGCSTVSSRTSNLIDGHLRIFYQVDKTICKYQRHRRGANINEGHHGTRGTQGGRARPKITRRRKRSESLSEDGSPHPECMKTMMRISEKQRRVESELEEDMVSRKPRKRRH